MQTSRRSPRVEEAAPTSSLANAAASRYRWAVLGVSVVAQAAFFGAVFQGLPALGPALRSAYDLGLGQLGLVLSSITAGVLGTLLLWGAATDRFGERRTMAAGLLGAAVALLVASRSPGVFGLAAALFAAGACGASVNVASGRAVMGWFAPAERGFAMGIRQTALPLGAGLAALVLPALASASDVGGALIFLAASCALAAGAVAGWVREPAGSPAGGASENTGRSPVRDRRVWRVALAGALLAIPQFGVMAFLVVFLHEELGYATGVAAGFFAVVQLLGGVGRVLAGRFSDAWRRRIGPLRGLGLGMATGLAAAAALIDAPVWVLLPVLLAASVLAMSWNGLAFTAVAEFAGKERSGTALGLYNTVMGPGAIAAPPAFAALVTLTSSWAIGFLAVAACSFLAVFVLAPLAHEEL
ncbi:MAG: MFS transporter [Rubrobacteraceae bacterium]|nr:MFS transporter [Rubrobacteraceae bacterium]MCL6437409.1 MFS transporter [Rubrobacteraceae bacterium]